MAARIAICKSHLPKHCSNGSMVCRRVGVVVPLLVEHRRVVMCRLSIDWRVVVPLLVQHRRVVMCRLVHMGTSSCRCSSSAGAASCAGSA